MLVITITTLIILLVSLASEVTFSTNAKDSVRNDNDNDMLKELLQRIDKMQSHIDQIRRQMDKIPSDIEQMKANIDRMERNSNIRFDQLDANMKDMKADNKNQSAVMETIVEQQMVITAEIFTVSQTLPFCCCQYQSTTDAEQPDTTTATTLKSLPSNCAEAMGKSGSDGVYKVNITNSDIGPFLVYCMKNPAKLEEFFINGTWMIIQRRQDNTTNFYQNWKMYQRGFGDKKGNYWIGLDKIHALTKSTEQELWVKLENLYNMTAWAKYSSFAIGDENEKYVLKTLGNYDGTAGDSLYPHKGQMWTTYDQDNDRHKDNCAKVYKGAWWFRENCGYSNLNGIYGNHKIAEGINWNDFGGQSISLKYAHMAIRPRA